MTKYKDPEWMLENISIIDETDIAQYATASTPETDTEKQRNIENLISRLINHCINETNSQAITKQP